MASTNHPIPDPNSVPIEPAAPPSLQANTIANYMSRGWTALVALLFLPLYALVLGPEAYGLIGAFAVLQAWALLFDFGLTPTLNREMARFQAGMRSRQSVADLLLSLEIVAITLCLMVAATIVFLAPLIATRLLKPQALDTTLVIDAIRVMGLVVAMRWIEQLYRAALQGMQDQVWLGKAFAVSETLRWAGAYAVIAYFRPSIVAFFEWQAVVSIAAIFLLRWRVKSNVSAAQRPRFSLAELRNIRHFAGGMFLSALLTFALTQIDKLIVAQMMPLSTFGYYMLASAAAGGLLQLILPMNQATLPRLTQYASAGEDEPLRSLFLSASRWMAVIIMPPCLLMAFFPEALMLLWTGDQLTVARVAPILPWLALGTMVNGVLNTPYMLQLAHGWTSISNIANVVAISIIVPLAYYVVPAYGATGAAAIFLVLNIGYLCFLPQITFRKLIPGTMWIWMRSALLLPLGTVGLVGLALRIATDIPTTRITAFLLLAGAGTLFLAASLWATRGPGSPFSAAKSALRNMVAGRKRARN